MDKRITKLRVSVNVRINRDTTYTLNDVSEKRSGTMVEREVEVTKDGEDGGEGILITTKCLTSERRPKV